jgi:hypothetical protein
VSTVSIDLPWYAKLVFRMGRPVVLVAALLMSIPGEIHLAIVAGWSPDVAKLMPVCVSVYAACSAVIADVAKRRNLPTRKSALIGAGAALILALAAQDVSHLIEQDYMHSSAILVGIVSAIPPLVVAHMLHMAAAPENTASVVEVDEPEDDFEDEHQEQAEKPRKRRRGRPGLTEAEVQVAIDRLNTAGEKVTPENLAKILNRAPRTARRYLSELKQQETAENAAGQQQAGMLPLSI